MMMMIMMTIMVCYFIYKENIYFLLALVLFKLLYIFAKREVLRDIMIISKKNKYCVYGCVGTG